MRCSCRRGTRGTTMQEALVSVSILTFLAAGVFTMVQDSERMMGLSLRTTKIREMGNELMHDLHRELEQGSAARVTIDATPASHDEVRFQVPLSVNLGVVQWGAFEVNPVTGVRTDHADHTIVYALRAAAGQQELVRRVLDPAAAQVGADQVLLSEVDNAIPGGAKGLTARLNGEILALELRQRRLSTDPARHDDTVRTHVTTVKLRN